MSRQDRRLSERVEESQERLLRAAEDRDDEVRTDEDAADDLRLDILRQQFMQDRLPKIPPIDGFHTIWLTTTNPGDTPMSRVRLGYEPVRLEDVPAEFHSMFVGSAAGAGNLLTVNELVAYKLPLRLYRRYMQHLHHDEPRREEEGIVAQIDAAKEQILHSGGKVFEGTGTAGLRKQPPPPRPETWGTGADPVTMQSVIRGQR